MTVTFHPIGGDLASQWATLLTQAEAPQDDVPSGVCDETCVRYGGTTPCSCDNGAIFGPGADRREP